MTDEGENKETIAEGILQQYGFATRCIDVVDNHWVALWFGAHEFQSRIINGTPYGFYTQREEHEQAARGFGNPAKLYLILIATPRGTALANAKEEKGVYTLDLRSHLPSTVLRPHAQHALILKCEDSEMQNDVSKNVVGILCIDCCKAIQWLGNGSLCSYESLFPSIIYDYGLQVLYQREKDIFKKEVFYRFFYC